MGKRKQQGMEKRRENMSSKRCDDCDALIVAEQAAKTTVKFGRGLCTICALIAKPLENQNKGDLEGLTPDEVEVLGVLEEHINAIAYRAERVTIMTDADGYNEKAQKELERAYRLKRAFKKIKERLTF